MTFWKDIIWSNVILFTVWKWWWCHYDNYGSMLAFLWNTKAYIINVEKLIHTASTLWDKHCSDRKNMLFFYLQLAISPNVYIIAYLYSLCKNRQLIIKKQWFIFHMGKHMCLWKQEISIKSSMISCLISYMVWQWQKHVM